MVLTSSKIHNTLSYESGMLLVIQIGFAKFKYRLICSHYICLTYHREFGLKNVKSFRNIAKLYHQ